MGNKKLIIVPAVVFILSTILLILGIQNGWFGEVREGLMKFCEHARDGFIKQPANSFSNLGFSFVGLVVAFQMYKGHFKENNALASNDYLTIVFSIGFIITGAGSFAMHATNGHWGGFSDLFGMFLISGFVFSYAFMRAFKLRIWSFLTVFFVLVLFSSIVYISPSLNFKGFMSGAEVCFIAMMVGGISLELYMIFAKGMQIKKKFGYASLLSIGIAFVIWNLSLWPDSIFCKPHSLIQGHAIWHLLDALGGYLAFRYYVSESSLILYP